MPEIQEGCASFFQVIVTAIESAAEFEVSPGIILGIFWLLGVGNSEQGNSRKSHAERS